MAIIACPDCGKKISSRSVICSFCGFQLGEVTEQDLELYRARRLRDQIYRLNMISYLVITVFVGGFGWYWWDSKGFLQPPSNGPLLLMGADRPCVYRGSRVAIQKPPFAASDAPKAGPDGWIGP